VHPQPLPHAIAEHEAGIEHGNSGFGARVERAVDVDEDRVVARIGGEVVGAESHKVSYHDAM
jgi:hypothetical protein